MKKRLFSLLVMLALLCVLSACDLLEDPSAGKDTSRESEKDKPPPDDITYYTLRLVDDDSDVISIGNGSRALTNDLAQASHDFFEVVFYYDNTSIARTTWNIGEKPELRGVKGNGKGNPAAGIAADDPVTYSSVSTPPSAVLFVGTKEDKTLLAVGRLINANQIISPTTTEVTFAVTALTAGTRFDYGDEDLGGDKTNSAFRTGYGSSDGQTISVANTTILNSIFIHYEDKKRFPLYLLKRDPNSNTQTGNRTDATYTFNTVTNDFSTYVPGIILAGGFNYEVRQPRYNITDGLYQTSSIFVQDIRQGLVSMLDNIVPATSAPAPPNYTYSPFVNPTRFQIVTTNSPDGSIFALVFEIMVFNLTPRPTTSDNSPPVRWRISPGMGTKWLDLDDGNGGEGGAILLGSGNITTWLTPYNWQ